MKGRMDIGPAMPVLELRVGKETTEIFQPIPDVGAIRRSALRRHSITTHQGGRLKDSHGMLQQVGEMLGIHPHLFCPHDDEGDREVYGG